jgi:hypothetical protein
LVFFLSSVDRIAWVPASFVAEALLVVVLVLPADIDPLLNHNPNETSMIKRENSDLAN